MITIVAGFGRCGSSLVMQMLAAGGMPTPHAEFPSYEINRTPEFLVSDLYGGAVKVLDPHINQPIMGPEYRWIWLDRDPVQQAKSMAKFWKATMVDMAGVGPGACREFTETQITKLSESFKRDRPRANGVMLKYTQPHKILKLSFEMILAEPWAAAVRLSAFCGGLDEKAMAAQVRLRDAMCLPYLLELEQLAEIGL